MSARILSSWGAGLGGASGSLGRLVTGPPFDPVSGPIPPRDRVGSDCGLSGCLLLGCGSLSVSLPSLATDVGRSGVSSGCTIGPGTACSGCSPSGLSTPIDSLSCSFTPVDKSTADIIFVLRPISTTRLVTSSQSTTCKLKLGGRRQNRLVLGKIEEVNLAGPPVKRVLGSYFYFLHSSGRMPP